MKKSEFLKTINRLFGILSILFFIYFLLILPNLQVKMVQFDLLTTVEEMMITSMGVGLLIFLVFYLLTLLQIVVFFRYAEKITAFSIFLIVAVVFCILLVFSDWALLTDIHKQYHDNLSQPEWSLLYPILGIQIFLTLLFVYLHFSGFFTHKDIDEISKDYNAFLLVHYVGLLTGLLGTMNQGMGFFFNRGWNFLVHTIIGGIILLFPYVVVVIYWGVTKLKEKDRSWFDEKQRLDLGRSAVFTLLFDVLIMSAVFVINIRRLDGFIQFVWFPLYLFSTIFFFSIGNLYFSRKGL